MGADAGGGVARRQGSMAAWRALAPFSLSVHSSLA
jgi:hypothetical protein